jgi:DNA mismatch repair protein MutS
MNFELDKQTIKDLEIFGNEKSTNSIIHCYNCTKTNGGKKHLHGLMYTPLTDINKLKQRSDTIKFIYDSKFELSINSGQFDFIEHYLNLNISALRNNFLDAYIQSISYKLKPLNDYYIIQSGIKQLIFLFKHLDEKLQSLVDSSLPKDLNNQIKHIQQLFAKQDIQKMLSSKEKISCVSLNRFDNLFRKKYKNEIIEIIQMVYRLDAIISIAKAARINKFSFAEYLEDSKPKTTITGLFHPLLDHPVPCDIDFDKTKNLCFLTGPNMAGKSTFLKSVGLSMYLAHLGFPVPAREMRTTIYNGIISTINLSDNMNKGYSHFYSEVKRVKETVLKIQEKGNLFIIFDELFRGTNVKDAFDASLLIIKSFTKISNSTFFISTHITEIAEEIKSISNIQFLYFDSELINDQAVYTYKLSSGVSYERLGMQIIRNENIIEILNSISGME